VHNAIVTNDNSTARDEQPPPSWIRRIILIVVVSGVLAVLAALAWPTIEKPLGLAALNLSRFSVAMIVSATFSITSFLVYFVAGKSLWQLLEIIIVPLTLATIGFWFTAQQDARQQRIENLRAGAERVLTEQRAQDEVLLAYLDQMGALLLEKNLRKSEENTEVRTLARARTLMVLGRLEDPSRKTALMEFLLEAELAQKVDERGPIIALSGANLSRADLSDANLSGDADLRGAVLNDADLSGADLNDVNLGDANLSRADLDDAYLGSANLSGANLSRADLSGANLSDAYLADARVSKEQLNRAYTLKGATMPDGQILKSNDSPDGPTFEEWRKSKGRGEAEENSGFS
jgi:uncharacterized protein YjbI with pentapeptide repeats